MSKFLGVNLPKILNQAMGKLVRQGKLVKITAGARDPNDLTAGQVSSKKNYPVNGFFDEFKLTDNPDNEAQIGNKKIVLFGGSLPAGIVPELNDLIVMENQTYIIDGPVTRDPAAATYTCEVRG